MDLPESAADQISKTSKKRGRLEEFIINPYYGKEKLTIQEAVDCINHLSGVLLADEYCKG